LAAGLRPNLREVLTLLSPRLYPPRARGGGGAGGEGPRDRGLRGGQGQRGAAVVVEIGRQR
jgi:hypothetical protein